MNAHAPGDVDLSELAPVFAACDDAEATRPLTEETLDVSFYDLGYDSLLLLQATEMLAARCGVNVPDAVVEFADTPRMLIEILNSCRHLDDAVGVTRRPAGPVRSADPVSAGEWRGAHRAGRAGAAVAAIQIGGLA